MPTERKQPRGNDEMIVASFTAPPSLLALLDEKARSLDRNRSQHLRILLRADLCGWRRGGRKVKEAA